MAEKLLDSLFKGDVKLDAFIKWLVVDDESSAPPNFTCCSRGEFISYFLNTIHEEAPCAEVGETPRKKTNADPLATPPENNRKPLRLFRDNSDAHAQLNKSQTFPPPAISSTPKTGANFSNYESPISPLYRQSANFSAKKSPALCLGDFVIAQPRKSTGKKKSRRINPTCLTANEPRKSNFDRCANSFDFGREVAELPVDGARTRLAAECARIVSRAPPKTVASFCAPAEKCESEVVAANLNSVTQRERLELAVGVYSAILRGNLALNLSSELYFLVCLLFRKHFNKSNGENIEGIAVLNDSDCGLTEILAEPPAFSAIFHTIHNVVFFAVKTIETIPDFFKILDKSTLKLLAEHKLIAGFSPDLAAKFAAFHREKRETLPEIFNAPADVNVCFISDTDNRENFPNDQAFAAFRKQRDLFYEILRVWEKNHLTSDWSFGVALGGKIRALLALHHEGVNYMHLARLFKNQLLSTYGRQNTDSLECKFALILGIFFFLLSAVLYHLIGDLFADGEESVTEEQLSFLSSIPNVSIDKVNRLKTRLVTKQSPNTINPTPDFTGLQEFYRDFLLIASTHTFIQHIKNVFIAEIFQLNDSNFTSNELESDNSNTVDVSTQKSFLTCLKSLRILAKFLGFLDALPYRLDSFPAEIVLTAQIYVREKSQPNFDLIPLLANAIAKNTLVLTIPWLTKYVSMLDYVTLRLPYYQKLFKQLFTIYRKIETAQNNVESSMLIKLCLGWLFELPNAPGNLYYTFGEALREEKFVLNELQLVDQNVLLVCCPYLKEIKKVLLSSNVASNEGVTVKHITPLTAVQSPAKIAKKRLEMQLEEAFFSGQPISVKKTVDFVGERIASTCVKHICNSVVPNFKKQASDDWKKVLEANKPITETFRPQLKRKAHEFASDCLKNLLKICRSETQKIIREKTSASVDALLALDVLPQTKVACTSIATRLSLERTEEWICAHVVITVFTKDFESELNRFVNNTVKRPKEKAAVALPLGGSTVAHNDSTCSAECLVGRIREVCLGLIEQPTGVDVNQIDSLLENALKTVTERCDVNDCILNVINQLLVDFFLLLVVHKTSIASQDTTQKTFKNIWQTYAGDKDSLFKALISPRNVMLLAQSGNVARAWDALAKFCAFLINEKLMTCETFEAQCVGIFKHEWDATSSKHITECFGAFLKYYSRSGGSASKFTLLIDFLSEFCCDFDVE